MQPKRSRYSFRQRSVEMADESFASTVRRWYSKNARELACTHTSKTLAFHDCADKRYALALGNLANHMEGLCIYLSLSHESSEVYDGRLPVSLPW